MSGSRRATIAATGVLVGIVLIVTAVLRGGLSAPFAAVPTNTQTFGESPVTAASSPQPSAACPGPWDCAQNLRFAQATELLKVTGHIGVVVRDRQTGAVWRAGEPDFRIWAGSTPKLAFAVALEEEARAAKIKLDDTAKQQIASMLSVSDNKAADSLWNTYAKDASAMMAKFQSYGMKSAGYVKGFPSRWGFVRCSAQDLANLMSYVLERLDPTLRSYIVGAMQGVGSVQHWGVWGAGAAMKPGVKNGWSIESDDGKNHWITATVGFAGPAERYEVAAMYHQPPGGDTIEKGVHTLTDVVATIFGAPVPAPVTIPADY